MGKIHFSNNGTNPCITGKATLKNFLKTIFKNESTEFKSVAYIFCTDEYIHGLNKDYLNHDTYTDILTFILSDKPSLIISEIYISIDRVRENALNLKIPYQEELLRVMIHGILHLCGYDDHSTIDKKLMRDKETFYLLKLRST